MSLLRRQAETAGIGDRAEVSKLLEFHRLRLSMLCELYIGCIDAHSLVWLRRGQQPMLKDRAFGSVQAVTPSPGAQVAPSRLHFPKGETSEAIRS
jgi:hypothetical protein